MLSVSRTVSFTSINRLDYSVIKFKTNGLCFFRLVQKQLLDRFKYLATSYSPSLIHCALSVMESSPLERIEQNAQLAENLITEIYSKVGLHIWNK